MECSSGSLCLEAYAYEPEYTEAELETMSEIELNRSNDRLQQNVEDWSIVTIVLKWHPPMNACVA